VQQRNVRHNGVVISGTLRTRAALGIQRELTLQVQASTGDSLLVLGQAVRAILLSHRSQLPGSRRPYSIAVSPARERGNHGGAGASTNGFCSSARRPFLSWRAGEGHCPECRGVAALLWLAVGVGGRPRNVMLQTPSGLNPGEALPLRLRHPLACDAASENIADYDSFVNVQAGGATYSGVLVDWARHRFDRFVTPSITSFRQPLRVLVSTARW